MQHNFSFWEYFEFEIKHFFRDLKEYFLENKSLKYYSLKYSKEQWKIGFFVFAILVSLCVLMMIFYFAVTKTYVFITPEINIREKGKNFIFREMSEETESLKDNLIQLRKVSKAIYLEDVFGTTWIDETQVGKSRGSVILINKLPETVKLFPRTRLQTATWVVLEIERAVEIPAASWEWESMSPGTLETTAISQIRDSSGKLVGTRANILENTALILPWLQENTDKIFAKTSSNFEWATDYQDEFVLSEFDIENAKKVIEEKLKSESLKALQVEIKKENDANNVTFDILWIDDIIKYSGFEAMILDGAKVWDNIKKFRLWWSINIQTYIYNKDSIISKLKTIVDDSILEWSEKLLLINQDSLRVSSVVAKQKSPFEIKLTMAVEAFVTHNFLNDNDSYVKKLKSSILWLSQDQAEKILLNDPKISNAKIDITPFFIHTVANIPNNIIFQIEENISK